MQHINAAVGRERLVEARAIEHAPAVDEDDHVGAQVALIVEHVAAQPRVRREDLVERAAQIGRRAVELRRLDETAQLRRELDAGQGPR